MVQLTFTDDEVATLRFLSQRFHSGSRWIDIQAIPIPADCDDSWRDRLVLRLVNYGLVEYDSVSSLVIHPKVAEVVHQIDHPPQPNYWKLLIAWWFAARWRVAVTAFVVILPLMVQWIEMLRTIHAWIFPVER